MRLVSVRSIQRRYPQPIFYSKNENKYQTMSIFGFPYFRSYFGPYFPFVGLGYLALFPFVGLTLIHQN